MKYFIFAILMVPSVEFSQNIEMTGSAAKPPVTLTLSQILSDLNEKEVIIEGDFWRGRYDSYFMFKDSETGVYFLPIMFVRPKDLKRLRKTLHGPVTVCRLFSYARQGLSR